MDPEWPKNKAASAALSAVTRCGLSEGNEVLLDKMTSLHKAIANGALKRYRREDLVVLGS